MWHGKSAVSRGSGYSHGRTVRRASKDSSVRMSNKAEAGFSMIGMFAALLVFGAFLWAIGVI